MLFLGAERPTKKTFIYNAAPSPKGKWTLFYTFFPPPSSKHIVVINVLYMFKDHSFPSVILTFTLIGSFSLICLHFGQYTKTILYFIETNLFLKFPFKFQMVVGKPKIDHFRISF